MNSTDPEDFDLGLSLDLDAFDLDAFDLDAPPPARPQTRHIARPPLHPPPPTHAVRYEHAQALADDLTPAILDGHRVDALVSGNFIFGDFLEAFAVAADLRIDDLTLSTLSISRDNVDSLENLLRGGYLGALNLVVSAYWFSHNKQNLPYIYDRLDLGDLFQLAPCGTHTKVSLLRIGPRKIVMHGSANLRSSRSLEAFTVETNPALYDLHMDWHRAVLDSYGTVDKSTKPLRAGPLFERVGGDKPATPNTPPQ